MDLSTSYLTDEILFCQVLMVPCPFRCVPSTERKVKAAYHLIARSFPSKLLVSGHAHEKVSQKPKADVRKKVATMIDVHKEQQLNDWLTPETLEKAIVKLNASRNIYPGYPEELPEHYKDMVDETASLFENLS